MGISIKVCSIKDAWELQHTIPEFSESYPITEYHERLNSKIHLNLLATINNEPVGFKVGYALNDKVFYSWMGGVLPKYRQQKIAQTLSNYQEEWARQNSFEIIRFKTRNYLKPMLCFGLKNGFNIIEVVTKYHKPSDYRVILEKRL